MRCWRLMCRHRPAFRVAAAGPLGRDDRHTCLLHYEQTVRAVATATGGVPTVRPVEDGAA